METRGLNPETRAGILFRPCPEPGPGFVEWVSPQAFPGVPRENSIIFQPQAVLENYGARIGSRIEP